MSDSPHHPPRDADDSGNDGPVDHPEGLPVDTRFPDHYEAASGKGDLHISGAGTIGMVLLLASLSILFLASIVALVAIRVQWTSDPQHTWPPLGIPPVPKSLWLSTVVILFASVTVQKALNAVRRGDDGRTARNLMATMVIGLLFLGMQTGNWIDYYMKIEHVVFNGAYMGMFYVLTALHAAHVIGGLIPLFVVYVKARRGRYSPNFHPGVRYVAAYWHFLDAVWVILFFVLYF